MNNFNKFSNNITAQRVKELREKRNLSQRNVAIRANISNAALSRIESCERYPNAETLAALALFFNVSTDYLLGLTDVPDRVNDDDYVPLTAEQEIIVDKIRVLPTEDLHLINGYIDKIIEKNKQLELELAKIINK